MNQRHGYKRHIRMFPLLIAAAALLLGAIVRFLWNAVLPELLNVNHITYWQAVGLLVLCRLLFGNFGGRMNGQGKWGNNWQASKKNFVDENESHSVPPWRGKWMNMTHEERIRFRQEMRNRCKKPPQNE